MSIIFDLLLFDFLRPNDRAAKMMRTDTGGAPRARGRVSFADP